MEPTQLGIEIEASAPPLRNQPLGVGAANARGYVVIKEDLGSDGTLRRRLLRRNTGQPFHAQTKINAYNFPFTGNPGAGCWFKCVYCYLRQPFFQRHISADHGKEMNLVPDFPRATREFLERHAHWPAYMKRVQLGVATELFMPGVMEHSRIDEALREFQRAAARGNVWMVHLVTKSPAILRCADLLAEMREQVQVEISFVTLDEQASEIFETGTPSVSARLRVVETLARRGVFVRMMLMPTLRQYALTDIGGGREILWFNELTGLSRPGRKRRLRDDLTGGFRHRLELHDGKRWVNEEAPGEWNAIVVRDWSRLDEAQRLFRETGALAYKQKDLNYYHVDELLAAHREQRAARSERGRSEDPSAEVLVHSGESVLDEAGAERRADVQAWHLPKSEWDGPCPPAVRRPVMDFGYRLHSPIDWADCV